MSKRAYGFTIVELLIVIVVIAILAAISIVAYTGIQQQARDAQRVSDVRQITAALEAYYIDNGHYPAITGAPTNILNGSWATTANEGWDLLLAQLEPYASGLGSDPVSTPNGSIFHSSVYNYAYFSSNSGGYCDVGRNQMYILVYRFEVRENVSTNAQDCIDSTRPIGPYHAASNYYGIKK